MDVFCKIKELGMFSLIRTFKGMLIFLLGWSFIFNGRAGEMDSSNLEKLSSGLKWLNVKRSLKAEDMAGRVVLLDFWTYCCINCIHVIPDLKYLEKKYGDDLLVIGVHCGKFNAEKDSENIRQAILRYEITHPVINDPEFSIWKYFNIHAWPSFILIDTNGKAVGTASGEGQRQVLDRAIGQLVRKRAGREKIPWDLELKKSSSKRALSFPGKVLVDKENRHLIIADSNNNRIVICDANGKLLKTIGSGKIGSSDGDYAKASFYHPQGLALKDNKIYVADTENHLLRRIDLSKEQVKTVAGTGIQGHLRSGSGSGLKTALNSPWALAFAPDGNLYIAMAGAHQIWRFLPDKQTIEWVAGTGRESIEDGSFETSAFSQPSGLAAFGNKLYVADSEVSAIRELDLRTKQVKTIVGKGLFDFGDRDGTAGEVRLQHALGVTTDPQGKLYVADTYNSKIKEIIPATLTSKTLNFKKLKLDEPGGIDYFNDKLYIADTNNNRIIIADLKEKTFEELKIPELKPPAEPPWQQFCPVNL
jgi:DNA-binding beta-propeller fold protein YncE